MRADCVSNCVCPKTYNILIHRDDCNMYTSHRVSMYDEPYRDRAVKHYLTQVAKTSITHAHRRHMRI